MILFSKLRVEKSAGEVSGEKEKLNVERLKNNDAG